LVADLQTPALVIDATAFDHNISTMAVALPGSRLRPHVKAHKCTEIALRQAAAGHRSFCCATSREVIGMARAGLGDDLLLANETVDSERLRAMAACDARVTVAVDSDATVEAAATARIREVLIDVCVGLPRCGCEPGDAGRLAELARLRGLTVRGVMGYEGHVVGLEDGSARAEQTAACMALLMQAHALTGGDVVSAGGTGTYSCNTWANEIQAGSYVLMDNAYDKLGLPFRRALQAVSTVVSVNDRWAVADCGLKALGMDHGDPTIDGASVWFCSDEHVTFAAEPLPRVGDRVIVRPAHVDPTIAYHDVLRVATGPGIGAEVIDTWPVDLRGW